MDLEIGRVDGRDRRAISLRQAVGRDDVSICHWHLLHKRCVTFTLGVKRRGVVTTAPDLLVRCAGGAGAAPPGKRGPAGSAPCHGGRIPPRTRRRRPDWPGTGAHAGFSWP